MFSIKRKI